MDKHDLSERDTCTKSITPAIQAAGWQQAQFQKEVSLTDGRVMVRGKLTARVRNREAKSASTTFFTHYRTFLRPLSRPRQCTLDAPRAISCTYLRDPAYTYLPEQGVDNVRRDVEGPDRAPLEAALGQSERCLQPPW